MTTSRFSFLMGELSLDLPEITCTEHRILNIVGTFGEKKNWNTRLVSKLNSWVLFPLVKICFDSIFPPTFKKCYSTGVLLLLLFFACMVFDEYQNIISAVIWVTDSFFNVLVFYDLFKISCFVLVFTLWLWWVRACFLWVYSIWSLLNFVHLQIHVLYQIWKIFRHDFFKYVCAQISFSFLFPGL